MTRLHWLLMLRAITSLSLAFALLGVCGQAQVAPQQSPTRKDSVDVSANISKKQLALEKQLNEALDQAEKYRSQGNFGDALKGFKNALASVQAEPLLKEQEDKVLLKVSRAYLEANQPGEAVRSYAALLQLRKNDCKPDARELELCADAQRNLGFAQMSDGNFSTALQTLREAAANYGNTAKAGHSEDFRMIKLKQQAETQTLLAVALARTGQRNDAIKIVESAIKQLETVQNNENIEASIRNSAQSSLVQAQKIFGAIKGN